MRKVVLAVAIAAVWAFTGAGSASAQALMGDQNMGNYADSNSAGVAQAFYYTASAAGNASDIDLYVNSGSTATAVLAGLYSDASGKPGTLLASGSLASPKAQTWNDIKFSRTAAVTQGTKYWIAILGTGGTLTYLDTTGSGTPSYVNSTKHLTSLPQTYSSGAQYDVSPASAYVNGSTATQAVLLGDQSSAPSADSNSAGVAQAFAYQATASGTTSDIELYVNSGTTASKLLLGIYADANGKPGSLLTSGSVASPKPQAWNEVGVGSVTVTAGHKYWIALLGTGGQIDYQDTWGGSGSSYVEATTGLTTLPATYSSGNEYNASPASAYILGLASSPPPPPPPPPSNTTAPAITGQTIQGQTLSTTNGSWTGSPSSYAYQWEDCNSSGGSCSGISGATSGSYTLGSSDVGHTIVAVVTATNAGGSSSAASGATGVVTSSGGGGGGGGGGGAQLFLSQSGGGSGSGGDCADAKAVSFFDSASDWGSGAGKIGPGVTVDLCGTISSPLTVQGSGSSSSPITVFWEPGATMSAPDWTGGGAVNTNGNSYITLNGGDNGTSIQATADGSGMADQGVASKGISASRCTGCTFENLTIANLYVHTSTSDSSVDQTSDNAIKWSGSNVTVADNTVHDVGWALWFSGSTGDTNEEIYGNDVYNIDHGIIIAPPATSIGNVFIFGNHIHDLANWDCGGACHHDPIHCFGSENGVLYSGFYIYDNLFDGSWGSATSSATFIEGNFGSSGDTPCAASGSSVWIFNNVSKPSDQMGCCGQIGNAAGGTGGMFNNMARGPSNTQNVGECMGYSASSNGSTAFFENNIMDNCDFLINGAASSSGGTTGTYASGTPDYDAYVNGGANAFSTHGPNGANCTFMPFSAFSSWKSCMGGVESHGNAFATETAAGINTDGSLNSGSPLIGTANNLTSTCNTFPTTPANVRAACETTYTGPPTGGGSGSTTAPTPRPTSGAWNIGPY